MNSTERLATVFFCKDAKLAKLNGMEQSDSYSHATVEIDHEKKQIITTLHSNWNSDYDVTYIANY